MKYKSHVNSFFNPPFMCHWTSTFFYKNFVRVKIFANNLCKLQGIQNLHALLEGEEVGEVHEVVGGVGVPDCHLARARLWHAHGRVASLAPTLL